MPKPPEAFAEGGFIFQGLKDSPIVRLLVFSYLLCERVKRSMDCRVALRAPRNDGGEEMLTMLTNIFHSPEKLTNIHKKAPGRAGAVNTVSIA